MFVFSQSPWLPNISKMLHVKLLGFSAWKLWINLVSTATECYWSNAVDSRVAN